VYNCKKLGVSDSDGISKLGLGLGLVSIFASLGLEQGRNQRKISKRAEVTFGNDYDVIGVQSTTMQPFCSDQLIN